jgi:hypothetical protein
VQNNIENNDVENDDVENDEVELNNVEQVPELQEPQVGLELYSMSTRLRPGINYLLSTAAGRRRHAHQLNK